MKANIFFLLLTLLSWGNALGQDSISIEREAVSYFFSNIYPEDFKDEGIKRLKFPGIVSMSDRTSIIFSDCFLYIQNSGKRLSNEKLDSVFSEKKLEMSLNGVNLCRICPFAKYSLHVSKASLFEDNSYLVRLYVIEKRSYIYAYYIMLNDEGIVTDWCLSSRII